MKNYPINPEMLPHEHYHIFHYMIKKNQQISIQSEEGCKIVKTFFFIKNLFGIYEYKIDGSKSLKIYKYPDIKLNTIDDSYISSQDINRWNPANEEINIQIWANGDSINSISNLIGNHFKINKSTKNLNLIKIHFSQLNNNDCGAFLVVFLDFLNRITEEEEKLVFKTNQDKELKTNQDKELEKLFFTSYCGKSTKITQDIVNKWRENIKNMLIRKIYLDFKIIE
ncbi:hypothetical protein DICPUDRAFT_159050 [Dictyostelium purpureum]|uniref:Uncharacterized protein n=1 Tax=Dictyostelium purpureum TaxID=5786 RepID=F1A354_DICPU|nr:uncharacterized protein DICPUDRAFT_159050 [Dictyostelium purpureum]EGC29376.1 hypothetical protein DICPUDRAFT_159050 [Dictyostelium purpureum]|eukprot:XP_003294104.1 hypothetical protein DICPUDRAFT_159050 [Dictyostelium purpureum]